MIILGHILIFLSGFPLVFLLFLDLPLTVTNVSSVWIIKFSFSYVDFCSFVVLFELFYFICNDLIDCWLPFPVRSITLSRLSVFCSDILHVYLQWKTSIRQLSRPKKSSAMEGCETHPTARLKWWGKSSWSSSPCSLQTKKRKKKDREEGKERCVWEILQSGADGVMSLDGWEGGQISIGRKVR